MQDSGDCCWNEISICLWNVRTLQIIVSVLLLLAVRLIRRNFQEYFFLLSLVCCLWWLASLLFIVVVGKKLLCYAWDIANTRLDLLWLRLWLLVWCLLEHQLSHPSQIRLGEHCDGPRLDLDRFDEQGELAVFVSIFNCRQRSIRASLTVSSLWNTELGL